MRETEGEIRQKFQRIGVLLEQLETEIAEARRALKGEEA